MRAIHRSLPTRLILALAVPFLAVTVAPVAADQIKLNVSLGHPVLRASERQTTYLKVGLTGFRFEREADRAPVNLALVIDTSGSMQGEKIERAREAAIMALHRLSSRDIASVVEYNNTVRVIVPATKLTDLESVCDAIRRLQPMSGTALFAGVSKGADEVRKFLGRDRVNRIVLLSDGLANVGPSSPHELGELGASLIREGISVTTIGLGNGYNEDLMSRLARRSDGNHYFAENSTDLAHIFRGELGDILTAVGQEVVVKINLADGIRPIRALGRDVEIAGQRAIATLSQIYSEQEKYILLEVEVPPTPAGEMRSVAAVEVSYANLQTRTADVLKSTVAARFSDSPEAIEKGCNKDVIIAAVEQLATITSKLAMKLRDEGKVSESRKVLQDNVKYLEENADKLKSDALKRYARVQEEDEKALDGTNYNARRKKMVEEQGRKESQQSGSGKRSAEN